MASNDYHDRFPIGIQTVVEDRVINGQMTYQVNTKHPDYWRISKTTLPNKIKQELIKQAFEFECLFKKQVDTRYVKRWLGGDFG